MHGFGGYGVTMLAHMISHNRNAQTSDVVNLSAQAATYTGAASAVAVSHLSLPEWAALVSMTVAVLGFLVQMALAVRVFAKDRQEAREERQAARAEREAQRDDREATRHAVVANEDRDGV